MEILPCRPYYADVKIQKRRGAAFATVGGDATVFSWLYAPGWRIIQFRQFSAWANRG
jgi:hypothetical protein